MGVLGWVLKEAFTAGVVEAGGDIVDICRDSTVLSRTGFTSGIGECIEDMVPEVMEGGLIRPGVTANTG
jgi:hypothetical protein